MTFYELIQACTKATSQAEILGLLQEHEQDESIKELFRLMLCPSIVYNIKGVPDCIEVSRLTSIDTDELLFYNLLAAFDGEPRGKELKQAVIALHQHCSANNAEVLSWILARKNPAKVGKAMVNKVWPDLIRTQRYMGAVPGSDEALERLFREALYVNVQVKEDGQTGLVDYVRGVPVSMHTRQGNRIDQFFPRFMKSLAERPGFNGMVHHEILVRSYPREKGNGLINKQIKNGTIGGPLDALLHSVLLDYVDNDALHVSQDTRYRIMHAFRRDVS